MKVCILFLAFFLGANCSWAQSIFSNVSCSYPLTRLDSSREINKPKTLSEYLNDTSTSTYGNAVIIKGLHYPTYTIRRDSNMYIVQKYRYSWGEIPSVTYRDWYLCKFKLDCTEIEILENKLFSQDSLWSSTTRYNEGKRVFTERKIYSGSGSTLIYKDSLSHISLRDSSSVIISGMLNESLLIGEWKLVDPISGISMSGRYSEKSIKQVDTVTIQNAEIPKKWVSWMKVGSWKLKDQKGRSLGKIIYKVDNEPIVKLNARGKSIDMIEFLKQIAIYESDLFKIMD